MELHYVYIYLYHVYQWYLLINNKIMFRHIWISRSRVQFPLALCIWRHHVTRSRDILLRKEIVRSAKQFVRFTGMREKFCDEILNFCTDLFKNIRISECLTNGYCECKQNVFALVYSITIPSVVNWNGIVINGEIGIKLSVLGTIECLEWKIGYVYVKISKLIWIFYRSLTDLRSMWKLICREISYEKQG